MSNCKDGYAYEYLPDVRVSQEVAANLKRQEFFTLLPSDIQERINANDISLSELRLGDVYETILAMPTNDEELPLDYIQQQAVLKADEIDDSGPLPVPLSQHNAAFLISVNASRNCAAAPDPYALMYFRSLAAQLILGHSFDEVFPLPGRPRRKPDKRERDYIVAKWINERLRQDSTLSLTETSSPAGVYHLAAKRFLMSARNCRSAYEDARATGDVPPKPERITAVQRRRRLQELLDEIEKMS